MNRAETTVTHRPRLLALIGVLALLAACSTGGSDDGSDETDSEVTTTTVDDSAASSDDPQDDDAGDDETEEDGDGDGDGNGGSVSDSDADAWAATAGAHRGADGERFDYDCPAGGEVHRIWGTEVYTDDSSVCTAAVHMGLIDLDRGGRVEIEIAPGRDNYVGMLGNGVSSMIWGSWDGSFVFPDADPDSVDFEADPASWETIASGFGAETGETVEHECSTDGSAGRIWGTEIYTDDSSICTAAVHMGLIDLDDGGRVRFEVLDGRDSYEGSEANGIESSSYGSWTRSFGFTDDQPN